MQQFALFNAVIQVNEASRSAGEVGRMDRGRAPMIPLADAMVLIDLEHVDGLNLLPQIVLEQDPHKSRQGA